MITLLGLVWRLKGLVPEELLAELLKTLHDARDPEAATRAALLGARERLALEDALMRGDGHHV